MVYGYFYWWYGPGLIQSWQVAVGLLYRTADFFSLDSLVRSWFSPWKNDVLSARNIALSDQVKIWEQNAASRFVGAVLRTIVIAISLICLGGLTIVLGVGLAIWLFVPALIILLPVLAVGLLP